MDRIMPEPKNRKGLIVWGFRIINKTPRLKFYIDKNNEKVESYLSSLSQSSGKTIGQWGLHLGTKTKQSPGESSSTSQPKTFTLTSNKSFLTNKDTSVTRF